MLAGGVLLAQGAAAEERLRLPGITVFGAARDERDLLDAPNAVSVIDAQEVLRRQPSTYADLLGDVPGVAIGGGPRGIAQEPNIRGFTDDQVVIRVDGARQNFNLAHRGRFFTDPDILKQVEVLRGGASTLFGSGALGGVIFLDTRDPDDVLAPDAAWGGRAKVGFNSQGTELLTSLTGAARAGDFDVLAFGAYRPMFDDLEDGDGEPILNSEIDAWNGLAKLGWNPAPGNRIEGSVQLYRDSGETPPNANVQGTPQTVVDRDLRYRSARIAWDWEAPENELLDLSVLAYRNDTSVEEDRIADGRLDETDFTTMGFEAANVSRFELGLPVALSYGVEVFRDEQEATRNGGPREQSPDATRLFYAAFAQADVAVTDTLTLTPGIRYDRYELDPDSAFEDRAEGQVSPRLALSYRPTADLQVWASASRSFRAPSLTELYNDGVHFAVEGFPLGRGTVFTGVNEFVPSPDLEPEVADQIEIGARWRAAELAAAGDRLDLSASAYYARVDDFVDSRVTFIDFSTGRFNPRTGRFEVGGTTTSTNVDAELWGFEAEGEYDAGLWFAGAALAIPRGRNRDGGGLGSIPQDRLVLTGGLRPFADVEIGGRATFADGQDDVPEGSLDTPGYAVFDIFANWVPSSGPLAGTAFSLVVDNVTDRAYRVHPNGLNDPGLAVKLAASIDF